MVHPSLELRSSSPFLIDYLFPSPFLIDYHFPSIHVPIISPFPFYSCTNHQSFPFYSCTNHHSFCSSSLGSSFPLITPCLKSFSLLAFIFPFPIVLTMVYTFTLVIIPIGLALHSLYLFSRSHPLSFSLLRFHPYWLHKLLTLDRRYHPSLSTRYHPYRLHSLLSTSFPFQSLSGVPLSLQSLSWLTRGFPLLSFSYLKYAPLPFQSLSRLHSWLLFLFMIISLPLTFLPLPFELVILAYLNYAIPLHDHYILTRSHPLLTAHFPIVLFSLSWLTFRSFSSFPLPYLLIRLPRLHSWFLPLAITLGFVSFPILGFWSLGATDMAFLVLFLASSFLHHGFGSSLLLGSYACGDPLSVRFQSSLVILKSYPFP